MICTKCKIEKSNNYFSKNKSNKTGFNGQCKNCFKEYYKNNKENIKSKYLKNKINILEKTKANYLNNKTKILERNKQYRIKNKEKVRKFYSNYMKNYNRLRRIKDLNFKLKQCLRNRLYSALKNNAKSGSAIRDLGCSIEVLKHHLESKFQNGMTWENYGKWHIDHIKPLSRFNLSNKDEFLKACHYSNLQPLWAIDNLNKSDNA